MPITSCPGFDTVRSAPGPSSHPPAVCLPLGRRPAAENAAHSLALPRLSPRYGSASAWSRRPSLRGRVAALHLFHHQALQSLADRFLKEERERVGIPHHVTAGGHEGVGRLVHGLFENLESFRQRTIQQRYSIFVEDVKDEGLQR